MESIAFVSVGVLLFLSASAPAEDGHGHSNEHGTQKAEAAQPARVLKAQETCPVMGGAIDKKVFVDHDGKRVYFCCESCKAEFKKDPETYLKKLGALGQQPEVLTQGLVPQKTCPVTGDPISKELYVDHKGKRIYVCCQGCIKEVKRYPEKYIKKLTEIGEKPGTI